VKTLVFHFQKSFELTELTDAGTHVAGGHPVHVYTWCNCGHAMQLHRQLLYEHISILMVPMPPALSLLLLLQETHPYFTLERIRAREGDVRARSFKEAADIATPVFHPPWQPLRCAPVASSAANASSQTKGQGVLAWFCLPCLPVLRAPVSIAYLIFHLSRAVLLCCHSACLPHSRDCQVCF
jgi:hypothetical protein